MRFALLAAIGLLVATSRGAAQSEESLRRFFEGKPVDRRFEVEFVEGVLIRFTASSR